MIFYDEIDANGAVVRSGFALGGYDSLPAGHQWVPHVASLDALKTQKKATIESWRDANIEADLVVQVGGINHQWQADSRSQTLLSSAVSLAAAGVVPAPTVWRDSANNDVTVTLDDLKAITLAIAVRTNMAYGHSWSLKATVDAAASPADLDLVVW